MDQTSDTNETDFPEKSASESMNHVTTWNLFMYLAYIKILPFGLAWQ